jgi:hypothetical protein
MNKMVNLKKTATRNGKDKTYFHFELRKNPKTERIRRVKVYD